MFVTSNDLLGRYDVPLENQTDVPVSLSANPVPISRQICCARLIWKTCMALLMMYTVQLPGQDFVFERLYHLYVADMSGWISDVGYGDKMLLLQSQLTMRSITLSQKCDDPRWHVTSVVIPVSLFKVMP